MLYMTLQRRVSNDASNQQISSLYRAGNSVEYQYLETFHVQNRQLNNVVFQIPPYHDYNGTLCIYWKLTFHTILMMTEAQNKKQNVQGKVTLCFKLLLVLWKGEHTLQEMSITKWLSAASDT